MATPQAALGWALTKIGCRYSRDLRMQANPDIFDCSSLVYRAYKAVGYTMTSGTTSTYEVYDPGFNLLWPSSRNELGGKLTNITNLIASGWTPTAGDLIFLNTDASTSRANKITHVVMVKDKNTIVHARGTAYGVREDSIMVYESKPRVVAVTRFKGGTAMPDDGYKELIINTKTDDLMLRAEPNTSANILARMPKSSMLLATGKTSGAWRHVIYFRDGHYARGWAHRDYLKEV